jgi:hypothetical protein
VNRSFLHAFWHGQLVEYLLRGLQGQSTQKLDRLRVFTIIVFLLVTPGIGHMSPGGKMMVYMNHKADLCVDHSNHPPMA